MFLLEDPTPIIVAGALVAAAFAIALLTTGRGIFLFGIVGTVVLTLLGVLVEWLVVTEREEVENAIEAAAVAVEANDLSRVKNYLAPEATDTIALVSWGMQRAKFSRAKINRLDVRVNRHTSPPTAKAELSGFLQFEDRRKEWPYGTHPVDGILELRRDARGWLVTGYTMKEDPRK